MTTPEDTRAMAEIMAKLQSASDAEISKYENSETSSPSTAASSGNVSPDAKEMFNILSKLQEAHTSATAQVVNEAINNDVNNATALYDDNQINMGSVNITMVKKKLVPGINKTYYNIYERGELVHEEIALFETAMGVVKYLVGQTKRDNIAKLIDYDTQYASALYESALHKERAKTLTESYKKDIALAKHGKCVSKMKNIKRSIKSLL